MAEHLSNITTRITAHIRMKCIKLWLQEIVQKPTFVIKDVCNMDIEPGKLGKLGIIHFFRNKKQLANLSIVTCFPLPYIISKQLLFSEKSNIFKVWFKYVKPANKVLNYISVNLVKVAMHNQWYG